MGLENGTSPIGKVIDGSARMMAREIVRHEERLFGAPRFSYDPYFDAVVQEYTLAFQQGFVPIFYTNHQAHSDVFVHGAMAQALTHISRMASPEEPLPGFVLPFATSLNSGHQGVFLQEFIHQLEPHAAKRNLILLAYTRPQDEAAGLDRNKIAFLRKLTEYIKEGYGLMLLPEGNVNGGRPQKGATSSEDIQGMRNFTSDFALIMRILAKEGKTPVFFPGGIHGTFRWQSREKRRAAIGPVFTLLFTSNDLPHVDVRLGMPVYLPAFAEIIAKQNKERSKEELAKIRDELSNVLAPHVAQLLPAPARGIWR